MKITQYKLTKLDVEIEFEKSLLEGVSNSPLDCAYSNPRTWQPSMAHPL